MTTAPSPSGFHRHRVIAWPESRLARQAVLVSVGVLAWFAILVALAFLRVPDSGWVAQLAIGVSGLAAAAAAIASAVGAVVALTRGERSAVLALPLLLGAFWTFLVVGELVAPH